VTITNETPSTKPKPRWLHQNGVVLALYVFATLFTDAHYMGDTVHYTADILQYPHAREFWDFGHVLWRPAGWLLSRLLSPLTHIAAVTDARTNIVYTLMTVSWLAGLACVLLLRDLLQRFCSQAVIVNAAIAAFILSNGFLNYAQTGSSYIPGLALFLLGLYILLRDGDKQHFWPTAALAGSVFAGAICLWFLYVLAIPAALAAPLLLFGAVRHRQRLLVQTAIAFTLVTALVYAAVLVGLEMYSVAAVRAWILSASHGILTGGFSRFVFTFAQSLIDLGDDGRLFKRYLVGDPFNPVSLTDLLGPSLWKLVLFYLFLGSIVINLLRSRMGQRILGLLILNAVPVIGFAIYWSQSRNFERFFPLYPLLFLSLSCSLCSQRTLSTHKILVAFFIVAAAITNVSVMAKPVLNDREEAVAARVSELQQAQRAKGPSAPRAIVIVAGDSELVGFGALFLLNPINRDLKFVMAITAGHTETPLWRKDLSAEILRKWKDGGDVWVTRRVLGMRPRPEWNWTEGDDPLVSWRDINAFFAELEMSQPVGGGDGFMLLLPTPKNEHDLQLHVRSVAAT
jgi:hypothetical protein